ncbi:MAG TPA: CBS domain-containing protein [Spirochaetia bacterium]|nr:CBS domain-containing protein [Spirochaetia bacterium]
METAREFLGRKGGAVHSVRPTASVFAALELMAQKNIGAVVVADENGKVHGIFSERDFARKAVGARKITEATGVKEIMTTRVVSINPDTRISECMALMTEKHIRHLPVLDGEKLVGLVSIGDVVKSLLSEQEMTISQQAYKIDQLETYMSLTP